MFDISKLEFKDDGEYVYLIQNQEFTDYLTSLTLLSGYGHWEAYHYIRTKVLDMFEYVRLEEYDTDGYWHKNNFSKYQAVCRYIAELLKELDV